VTPRHHIGDDLLLSYAAGSLSEGWSLAVATHLAMRDYVGGDVDTIKWKALGKGAAQLRIRTGDGETQVRLLKIPAGKPVPEHSHSGRELTLVLCGAFDDGEERFARGDIEDADASVQHVPTATKDEDCICLAVTDAPLRFRSWIVRALQPILGI
jgi:putative transcriptional regulator